jgi:hypothetical protein
MSDLCEAHATLVATCSQGSVVSTHSLDRFIWDGHIVTRGTSSRGEHTCPTVLAGLPMGTGAEAFLLSTWAILAMRQWERRVERSVRRVCCPALVWDSFGPVEVSKFEHDPGAVSSGDGPFVIS